MLPLPWDSVKLPEVAGTIKNRCWVGVGGVSESLQGRAPLNGMEGFHPPV